MLCYDAASERETTPNRKVSTIQLAPTPDTFVMSSHCFVSPSVFGHRKFGILQSSLGRRDSHLPCGALDEHDAIPLRHLKRPYLEADPALLTPPGRSEHFPLCFD
eukprot:scaffold9209_cov108-Skeletonema_dohrnii-CCMP3373.AAC.2